MSTIGRYGPNDGHLAMIGSIVKESIDQTMKDLLGEQGAQSTFFHIGIADYEKQTNEFHFRLYSIFKAGSSTIEKMIVKDLYKRLNIPLQDWEGCDYKTSVEYAMRVVHERAVQGRRT